MWKRDVNSGLILRNKDTGILCNTCCGFVPEFSTCDCCCFLNPTPDAWSSIITYQWGDCVMYSSVQWYSTVQGDNLNHTPEVGQHWARYYPCEAKEIQEWSVESLYTWFHCVLYNDVYWYSTRYENVGHEPGTDEWWARYYPAEVSIPWNGVPPFGGIGRTPKYYVIHILWDTQSSNWAGVGCDPPCQTLHSYGAVRVVVEYDCNLKRWTTKSAYGYTHGEQRVACKVEEYEVPYGPANVDIDLVLHLNSGNNTSAFIIQHFNWLVYDVSFPIDPCELKGSRQYSTGSIPNEYGCDPTIKNYTVSWQPLNPRTIFIAECIRMPAVECANPLEHKGYAKFAIKTVEENPAKGVKVSFSYTGVMTGSDDVYTDAEGYAHCYTDCPSAGENGEIEFCVDYIDTEGTGYVYDEGMNICSCAKSQVLDCGNDTVPPEPDPGMWATRPTTIYQNGHFYHKMIATAAEDQCSEVEYLFDCTTNPAYSSGWQSSSTWQVQVSGQFDPQSYRTKSRDANHNETAWSTTVEVDT